jgi:hypothetical protein
MSMANPLSPAAQEIYDAFNRVGLYNKPSFETDRKALAAALRAAAKQMKCAADFFRLTAIADELEGTNGWH